MKILLFVASLGISLLTLLSIDMKESTPEVHEITKIRVKEDSVQNVFQGVCDTCVSSYNAEIILNRQLILKLSEQNYTLVQLIAKNDSIINAND